MSKVSIFFYYETVFLNYELRACGLQICVSWLLGKRVAFKGKGLKIKSQN